MAPDEAEKIAGRPVPWFEGARGMIARAEPGGEKALDWIQKSIEAGRLSLFRVRDEWQEIGIFTARIAEQYTGEKHLLIIHGVSLVEEDGFSFLLKVENLVKKIAKDCGCSRVEIHTRRRGMDRVLQSRGGYQFQETILSVEV
jgi:hypothetical protein